MQRINNLTGSLPSMAAMTQLQVLRLGHNLLSGSMPADMFTSPRLQLFSIEYNSISGPLPDFPPAASWLQSSAPLLQATASCTCMSTLGTLGWSPIHALYVPFHTQLLCGPVEQRGP